MDNKNLFYNDPKPTDYLTDYGKGFVPDIDPKKILLRRVYLLDQLMVVNGLQWKKLKLLIELFMNH